MDNNCDYICVVEKIAESGTSVVIVSVDDDASFLRSIESNERTSSKDIIYFWLSDYSHSLSNLSYPVGSMSQYIPEPTNRTTSNTERFLDYWEKLDPTVFVDDDEDRTSLGRYD